MSETVEIPVTFRVWDLSDVDELLDVEYSDLRVAEAEIVGEPGDEELQIVLEAEGGVES